MDGSTPGFTVLYHLLELFKLMSIESIMPSNHLILYGLHLLLPSIFPSIRVFSNELALCIMWPKYWSFSFSISPSKLKLIFSDINIFFNDTATTEIYTLSLHDALPISISSSPALFSFCPQSSTASGSFPVSWLFASGGQSIGASSTTILQHN